MTKSATPGVGLDLPKQRRWLVTGAAGFIGSNLIEALLAAGQDVIGLDNFSTGHRRNLDRVQARTGDGFSRFRLIEGDIRDPEICATACAGVNVVLHHAALASVPLSMEQPLLAHAVNVTGTVNLLDAARQAGVRRFVYASSSAVYGDCADMPQREDRTGNPLSPYAATKAINEVDGALYTAAYGLGCVGLRYFNVYGPRQDPNGAYAAVIPRWIEAAVAGRPVTINGSGAISRDFCFIDDVVRANVAAALGPEQLGGKVFNIATGSSVTLDELLAAIRDAAASEGIDYAVEPVTGPPRPGDIIDSAADTALAARELGFEAQCRLSDGIRETFRYFRGH